MKNLKQFLLLLMFSFGFVSANAQQGDIQLKNEAFKEIEVTKPNGEKEFKLEPPGTVVPKDEILYITTFSNTGAEPATDIVITNPLPNNSLYKAGSAFGAGTEITFSIDGGKTYAKPDELKTSAGGQLITAEPKDYTHIRWVYTKELQPATESTVTFRTIIK